MKERPILFSGPMVRAILEGRKTQTRRVIKPQPKSELFRVGHYHETCIDRHGNEYPSCDEMFGISSEDGEWSTKCPYGVDGDRLWVRETWFDNQASDDGCTDQSPARCVYRADGEFGEQFASDYLHAKWTPSIHMPRWASRIDLEITGVRVERLNEISDADAMAEGCEGLKHVPSVGGMLDPPRFEFQRLWESINGQGSWAANPWVWVVEFKRVETGQ